jgi:hypothetical protein
MDARALNRLCCWQGHQRPQRNQAAQHADCW